MLRHATISVSMASHAVFEWEAHEFEKQHKSSDWYWGLGIAVIVLASVSFIFNNVILGILVIIAGFLIALFAMNHHEPSRFALTGRGLVVDDELFPFQTLESFWVDTSDKHRTPRLLVKSQKLTMPLIVIPLEDVDEEEIEEFIGRYLPLDEHTEPIAHKLFERLGF